MNGLRDKVALVTGASRGIGRAIAVRLGTEGTHVAVNFAARGDAAAQVVGEIERAGARGVALRADMADPEAVVSLFDAAEQALGPLDIVINNAGYVTFGPTADLPLAELDRALALNVRGTYTALQEAARRVRDGGRIVSISTGGTLRPSPAAGVYHAGKAALEQLSMALAHELGPRGVTVNVVRPGLTRTDGLVLPPEVIEGMVAQTPLRRVGEPEDVAAVVAFLASDDARWVTGQCINAAGGLV